MRRGELALWLALLLQAAASVSGVAAEIRVGTLEADVSLDVLNVVMDAPWRVYLRPERQHYVPVLYFFPETKEGWRRVQVLEVSLADADSPGSPALFVSSPAKGGRAFGPTPSGLSGTGLQIMDGFGRTTSNLELVSPTEPPQGPNAPWQVCEINDENRGWHTILILPIPAEVSARGRQTIHLLASVKYRRLDGVFNTEHTLRRKLEIELDPAPWPSFAGWRSFDTHVHTIAEYCSELSYKALRRNYGGPVRMLFESAYALGFIDSPEEGKNRVITTDHNNYYSDRDWPRYGPTAEGIIPGRIELQHPEYSHYFIDLNGKHIAEGQKEFENYNDLVGITRGEELSLAKSPGTIGALIGSLSAHLLLFSTRNFVGPFHGGRFLFWRSEQNPNRLDWVLGQVTHDPNFPFGFAYAAHPFARGGLAERFDTVWNSEHYEIALRGDYIRKVNGVERDFVFKGFELWNEKNTREIDLSVAQAPLIRSVLEDPSTNDRWNAGEPNWDGHLQYSLWRWHQMVAQGLSAHSLAGEDVRFVRKLFICAGSDAHGDFNRRSDTAGRGFASLPSILSRLFKFFWMTDNAFGRVRTVVDTTTIEHPSPVDSPERALMALAHGQGVMTDGPVLDFKLDADGHLDGKSLTWHADVRYEDDDGRIGGDGALDGGRTMLVAAGGAAEPMLAFRWQGAETFGGELKRIEVYRDTQAKPVKLVTVKRNTGKAEVLEPTGLLDPNAPVSGGWRVVPMAGVRGLGSIPVPSAFSLGGFTERTNKPPFDFRCYTNPIWALPVQCSVVQGKAGVRATLRFPISMQPKAVAARLVPVDAKGDAAGPGVALSPVGGTNGWTAAARTGVANAVYSLTASGPVEGRSHVLILEPPADAHANKLNAVAWKLEL